MANEFKIEKNISITPRCAYSKWPFSRMAVGESFLLPAGTNRAAAATAASYFGKRNNKKYSIRKTEDGIRCWRTA